MLGVPVASCPNDTVQARTICDVRALKLTVHALYHAPEAWPSPIRMFKRIALIPTPYLHEGTKNRRIINEGFRDLRVFVIDAGEISIGRLASRRDDR